MTLSLIWEALYWGWFASEIIIGVATRTKRSSGKVHDRGSLLLLWSVIVISLTACQWISEIGCKNMFGGGHWLKVAAVIVMVIGLAIRWTAIITLGRSFSSNVAILDSQKIMRTGVFGLVRHPSYLGLLLVFLAVGLHSRSWAAFALAVVPTTAVLLYRIRVEEAALRAAFGEEYLAYSRETKRLIPGVYLTGGLKGRDHRI
jgi:protein-S-isoprenylcysteine O-methyltransferase Ste14